MSLRIGKGVVDMFAAEEIQSLNELELGVYQYVTRHWDSVSYMRIRELAAEAHVSTSTILRFCKKMGCDGYAEFKIRIREYAGRQSVAPIPENFSELKAFFDRMETKKLQRKLESAASLAAKADRVIFIGIGNSGNIAQYGARYFSNLGKFSSYVSDPFYPMGQISVISTAAIVLSVSGESEQVIRIVNELKTAGCHIICITNTEHSTVAKLSDVSLPYYITMHRDEAQVDYSSQVPAVFLVETLGKRVHSRLTEDTEN